MTHPIRGCDSCPFHYAGRGDIERCGHPNGDNTPTSADRRFDADDKPVDKPHPDWCPLLQGAITIELEKQ